MRRYVMSAVLGTTIFSVGLWTWTGWPRQEPSRTSAANRPVHLDSAQRVRRILQNGLRSGFEPNVGQVHSSVEFVARHRGLAITLDGGNAAFHLAGGRDVVRMNLARGARRTHGEPAGPLGATIQYYRGSDTGTWRSKVPTFSQVTYPGVYRGVDLIYYIGANGQLEHDFVVAPGARAAAIDLRIEGSRSIHVDTAGDLQIATTRGLMTLRRPVMYQVDGGVRQPVSGRYVMRGARDVGFDVGSYDRARALWIDPVIDYATYFGGGGTDQATDIAVDAAGNTFVTGSTQSLDFPTVNAWQPQMQGFQDAFVAKFDASGSLQYCTYLGGDSSDIGRGIVADSRGDVYVVGTTHWSAGVPVPFPTSAGAFQTVGQGGYDAFVTKLDSSGALVTSTLLGGSNQDEGAAIAVDANGNAYVTGMTWSTDFPLVSPIQPANGGLIDAFATKLNADMSALEYSTFVGGSRTDTGLAAAIDAAGNLAIAGTTASADFPTASPLLDSLAGQSDAFVTKVNASGSAFVFSTYLGGSVEDQATAIAVDAGGAIVVGGITTSPDLPGALPSSGIAGPQSPINGSYEDDAFVAKLSGAGALLFTAYVGGNAVDTLRDLAIDGAGSMFVTGVTRSANLPREDNRSGDIGAFGSADGGATWTPRGGSLRSASITAIVLDPATPTTVYAGTDRDGVFKSTDGGETWSPSSHGLASPFITALVVDPISTSTLYAATYGTWGTFDSNVFKTVDAGAHWARVGPGIVIQSVISLAIDSANPANLYAGTLMRGAAVLYRTQNAGATWAPVFHGQVNALAVDPATSSIVYAASSIFLYKSVDGGSTWNVSFTEAAHLAPLTTVVVNPFDPRTLYVGTAGRGVYKSTDGGVTWAAANAGLTYPDVSTLALDPAHPDTLYAGTYGRGVFKSGDGGTTWAPQNTGIADAQVTHLAVDPHDSDNVHMAVDGLYGDGYVAVLSADGALVSSSYVGGSGSDYGTGIAASRTGTVHIAGTTRSRDWPASPDALQATFAGGFSDAFVLRAGCLAPLAFASVRVSPQVLWPPDHRMIPVSLDYELTGACGATTCSLGVTSNEPVNGTGDGDAEPDWQVVDARHVTLRAERDGSGLGRTYDISIACSDEQGRRVIRSALVSVPLRLTPR